MKIRTPRPIGMVCAALTLLALVAAPGADAQIRYDRGQNVAPVFEGWERNSDGTFNMVFGYMNRNYQEMPEAPIGAANSFEPGPADRGQPTRFYPRRQQFVFRVQVPADWGEKNLVWTVTTNGRTDRAIGRLWLAWEIDDGVIRANRGMGARGAPADNQNPSIAIPGGTDLTVTLPDTLTITAVVGDDGIPGPRPRPPERVTTTTRNARPGSRPTPPAGRAAPTPRTRPSSTRGWRARRGSASPGSTTGGRAGSASTR